MMNKLIRLLNPSKFVALHRNLQFRVAALCGAGLRVTERACIFPHQARRSAISIGENSCIDGTIEVYNDGVLSIGRNFFLGRSRLYCSGNMRIGDYVLISDNVAIMDGDLHPMQASDRRRAADQWSAGNFPHIPPAEDKSSIKIDDDVWIGYGVVILKGVSIGRGAIIGAGSIVTSDVPPWCIAVGSPARVIRELSEDER